MRIVLPAAQIDVAALAIVRNERAGSAYAGIDWCAHVARTLRFFSAGILPGARSST